MLKVSCLLLALLSHATMHLPPPSTGHHLPPATGRDIIKKMHDRYTGKWYHSFTFNQTTEFYQNDSLRRTQTWWEAIRFPDRFRIDFGEADSGNAVIFRGDSAYNFRNGKLRSSRINKDDLTFLLGGLYFYTFDSACKKLTSLHYDLTRAHEDTWQGKPVYVVGAGKGEEKVNQLWIDQKNLYLVRMLTYEDNRKEEALFDGHRPFAGGWSETKCRFYFNDKLVQVETYHDCVPNQPLEDRLFDPVAFIKRK